MAGTEASHISGGTGLFIRGGGCSVLRVLPEEVAARAVHIEMCLLINSGGYMPALAPQGVPESFKIPMNTYCYLVVTDCELILLLAKNLRTSPIVRVPLDHVVGVETNKEAENRDRANFILGDIVFQAHAKTVVVRERFSETFARKRFLGSEVKKNKKKKKEKEKTEEEKKKKKEKKAASPSTSGGGRWGAFFGRGKQRKSAAAGSSIDGSNVSESEPNQAAQQQQGGFVTPVRQKKLLPTGTPPHSSSSQNMKYVSPRTPMEGPLDENRRVISNLSESLGKGGIEGEDYIHDLEVMTIEPTTLLPYFIDWATRSFTIRDQLEKAAPVGNFWIATPSAKQIKKLTGQAWNYRDVGQRTSLLSPTSGQKLLQVAVDADTSSAWLRNLYLDYDSFLKKKFHIFDADEGLLRELQQAILEPFIRNSLIESDCALPRLIHRLRIALDIFDGQSESRVERYMHAMAIDGASSEAGQRWLRLVDTYERSEARKKAIILFEIIIYLLNDSAGCPMVVRLAAPKRVDGLAALAQSCFNLGTGNYSDRRNESLSRNESLLRGEDGGDIVFAPKATYHEKRDIDDRFLDLIASLLFQAAGVQGHAYALGSAQSENFLDEALSDVPVQDVKHLAVAFFERLSKLIFHMTDEKHETQAMQTGMVLEMMLRCRRTPILPAYLKKNFEEEIKYLLLTDVGSRVMKETARHSIKAAWAIKSYVGILGACSEAPGLRLEVKDLYY